MEGTIVWKEGPGISGRWDPNDIFDEDIARVLEGQEELIYKKFYELWIKYGNDPLTFDVNKNLFNK